MEQKQVAAIAIIVIIIVAAIGVGWYAASDHGGDDHPTEVVDAAGNTIKLDEVPERITSTTVTATEMLCNLGFRSAIVGATTDSGVYDVDADVVGFDGIELDYPATIQSDLDSGAIANIGTWSNWTAESVAASNPDLVVMDYDQISTDSSRMTQLQSLGVPCIVLYTDAGIDNIVRNYTMLGTALGSTDEAQAISDRLVDISEAIYDVAEQYSTDLKVAHICYCWGSYYIYNSSSLMQVVLDLGGTNALPTSQSYATITAEDIAAADIDLIIFDDMATGLNWEEVIAEWKADPVMGSIEAIANDDIYCLEYSPFQATSYDTVHFVEGQALIETIMFADELGIDVPNIITDDDWKTYIQWVDELV